MSIIDDMAKGLIADSALSTALAKPLAEVNVAVQQTIKAMLEWQIALVSFEKVLSDYGIKPEIQK